MTISPKGLFAGAQTFKFAMPSLNQTATSTGGPQRSIVVRHRPFFPMGAASTRR